jgi:hypothetical protein
MDLHDRQPGPLVLVRVQSIGGRTPENIDSRVDLPHGLRPEVLVLRRRDVDQVERLSRRPQECEGIGPPNVGAVGETGVCQVFLDDGDGLVTEIGERTVRSPLTQCLDSNATTPRKEIEHVHPFNSRAKDVKERGLDTIEDRPRATTGNQQQLLPSSRSRHHSHQ